MAKGVLILAVVLLLLLAHISVSSSVKLTIYPSCSGRSRHCLTLNRLTSHAAPAISLIFAPGVHRYALSSNLVFQNARFIEFKALSSTAETTIKCGSHQSRRSIRIHNSKNISVTGLAFSDCYLYVWGSRNIIISTSKFINNRYRVLYVYYSHNITVDKSIFFNNSDTTYTTMIQFSQSSDIKFTRNNFTYNTISSKYGGVKFVQSKGFVGCCNFRYNEVSSTEHGLIALQSSSLITVTNSTFDDNSVSSYSSGITTLASPGDNLVIVSSSFTTGTNNRYNRIVFLRNSATSATIIASKFVGNRNSYRLPIYTVSRDVAIYCSTFVNMTLPLQYFKNKAGLCEQYRGPDAETCENSQCHCKHINNASKSFSNNIINDIIDCMFE